MRSSLILFSYYSSITILLGALLVCSESIIIGDVTISGGNNIDPSASIIAEEGPIEIAGGNNIEALVQIINRYVLNLSYTM